jgi:hypothetical protein
MEPQPDPSSLGFERRLGFVVVGLIALGFTTTLDFVDSMGLRDRARLHRHGR